MNTAQHRVERLLVVAGVALLLVGSAATGKELAPHSQPPSSTFRASSSRPTSAPRHDGGRAGLTFTDAQAARRNASLARLRLANAESALKARRAADFLNRRLTLLKSNLRPGEQAGTRR